MRVVLTGGGTGGHVFPLLAVAEQLRTLAPDCRFHWFGSRRLEAAVVPQFGLAGTFVPFTFSYRRLSRNALAYYFRVLPGWLAGYPVWAAIGLLRRFQPDIVISSGGYVSAPMLLAALTAGVPFALLEVNAVPGRVTVLFAPFAARLYCATASIAAAIARYAAPGAVKTVGFPSAPQETGKATRESLGLPDGLPLVVVVGGSTGSAAVNRLLAEAFADSGFAEKLGSRLAILHQWGHEPSPRECAPFVRWPHYRAVAFHPGLAQLYRDATLYIGRAGAATIGELVNARLPAVLIPYPLHADHQQYHNARALVAAGAAVLLHEDEPAAAGRLRRLVEELALGDAGLAMRQRFAGFPGNGAEAIARDLAAGACGGVA